MRAKKLAVRQYLKLQTGKHERGRCVMKWSRRVSLLGSAVARAGRIDWSRRDVKDAVAVFAVAILAFFLEEWMHLFDKLYQFSKDYEHLELDDLVFAFIVFSIAMAVFGYRRVQDLSREIKARRAAELEAHNLARHDPLTGLPNRRCFTERLEEALRQITYDGRRAAVLVLDLDGFKPINDLYGHAAGDEALVAFAERISSTIPSGVILARIGGDEFAIIQPKISSLDDTTRLARRIIGALAEPFAVAATETTLGVGIGIVVAPDDGIHSEELVRRADLALYRAKAEGRSNIRFFEVEMDAHLERRMRIERELRAAISANVIVPHYQPLISLEGNRLIGFEALARWERQDSDPIGPEEFITIAEESGLIGQLGDQLLRSACLEANHWPADLILSFNISPMQLRNQSLGLRILSILGETGLNPRRLELEITESALVSNMGVARQVIIGLREAGVRVAIDDFGTGYATMSQLLELRFDKIKIDRSFVTRLGSDPESAVIIRAILGLATGFGMTTTAEGIEENSQLVFLRQSGCLQGQGYLFSKPVPASQIPALLGTFEPAAAVG
jgi:diguanylate cyclase (GGDEF)-like protein